MKHSLLLLGVLAALAIGAPAYSQFIYMDVNGSGTCTSADALTSSITSVDVWLNTDHNANGSTATCSAPAKPLDIFSYAVIIHQSGSGTVTFNSWTNTLANFAQVSALRTAGPDMGVGYAQQPPGSVTAPGLYKLGTVNVTVTGTPALSFLSLAPDPTFVDFTGFGTTCTGSVFGNSEVLGFDFLDNCGTATPTPTTSTTWGRIKQLYK